MMARVVLLLTFVTLILGSVEVRSEEIEQAKTVTKRSEVCYKDLGCFSNDGPFQGGGWGPTLLPHKPDLIKTTFILFTRESKNTPQILDARYPKHLSTTWTNFKKTRPIKIIIHGLLDGLYITDWWQEMIKQLLIHVDYNVIFVDWSGGNLPPYMQAAANTRVVGAQVAKLIEALMAGPRAAKSDFHLIGMSLGAHIVGHAGERVPGLGRITGLDPAGPYFEDKAKVVRLDETDAEFVDIMHTDMKATRLLQITGGTKTHSGHIDIFPNLGYNQPGCGETGSDVYSNPDLGCDQPGSDEIVFGTTFTSGITSEAGKALLCSHVRSIALFSESINSLCPFIAYPCASEEDFVNNRCHSCANGGCAKMGFHATKNASSSDQQVKYFLTTGDSPPFCRYHFIVTIKLSANVGAEQRGTLGLVIDGDVVTHSEVSLTEKPETFQPGQSYTFYIMLPQNVGNVESLTLLWKQAPPASMYGSSASVSKKTKNLFLDEISIVSEEVGVDARFCAGGTEVLTGRALTVSTKC